MIAFFGGLVVSALALVGSRIGLVVSVLVWSFQLTVAHYSRFAESSLTPKQYFP